MTDSDWFSRNPIRTDRFLMSISGLSQESPDSRQFRRILIGKCGLTKIFSGTHVFNWRFPAICDLGLGMPQESFQPVASSALFENFTRFLDNDRSCFQIGRA